MKKIIILAAIGQILALSTVDATPTKKFPEGCSNNESMRNSKKRTLRSVLPLLANGAKAGLLMVSAAQNPAVAAGMIGGDVAGLVGESIDTKLAKSKPSYAKRTRVRKALRAGCRVGGAFAGAFVATRETASAAVTTSAHVVSMAFRYCDNVLQRRSVRYRNIRNHTALGPVSDVALYAARLVTTNYLAHGVQNLIMNQTPTAVQATVPADAAGRAPQCPVPNWNADSVCPMNATFASGSNMTSMQPGSFPAAIPTVSLGEAADVDDGVCYTVCPADVPPVCEFNFMEHGTTPADDLFEQGGGQRGVSGWFMDNAVNAGATAIGGGCAAAAITAYFLG